MGNTASSLKFGGLDTLGSDEKMSYLSSTKRALIIQIAKLLKEKLHIKGIDDALGSDPENADIEKVVKAMWDFMPLPDKKNGKTFTEKGSAQEKTCKILAETINKTVGNKLIDIDKSASSICNEVREFMGTLMTGISEEIVVAKGDIEKRIKNIQIVNDLFERAGNELINVVKKCEELSPQANNFIAAFDAIKKEMHYQMELLKLMLDTIVKPTESEINELLESNKRLKVFKSVKLGTPEMSQVIVATLHGATLTAAVAKAMDKALKELGLKYADIKDISVGQLLDLFSEKVNSILKMKDDVAFAKVQKAIETIKHNFMLVDPDVLQAEIDKLNKKQGGCPTCGADEDIDELIEGAEEHEKVGGLKLDKRVERRDKTIKLLVEAFNHQMHNIIQKILISSKLFAQSIASGHIELNEQLRKFTKALEILPNLEKRHTYFAVSGLYTHISARQDREQFISSAKYIISTIDDLLASGKNKDEFKHLSDIKLAFQAMINLIDAYVKKFAEGFGPITSWEEYKKSLNEKVGGKFSVTNILNRLEETWKGVKPIFKSVKENIKSSISKKEKGKEKEAEKKEGAEEMEDDRLGQMDKIVVDEVIQGGDVNIADVSRVGYDLKDAINSILYYYRTAMIRRNLKNFVKENESYGSDYVKILGDAIADGLDKVSEDKDTYKKLFKRAAGNAYYDRLMTVPNANEKDVKKRLEGEEKFYTSLFDAKEKMYKTAEAIDLYMKEFTASIAANPDDIKDIISILNNTEMISQWFSDTSGDMLCQVFDSFPRYIAGTGSVRTRLSQISFEEQLKNHYYVRVAAIGDLSPYAAIQGEFGIPPQAKWQPATLATTHPLPSVPGNPFLPVSVAVDPRDPKSKTGEGTAAKIVEYIQTAINTGALKNIISAFVNIGEKFGGKELMKKTHMSPKMILKNLQDYMTFSAFMPGNYTKTLNGFTLDNDYGVPNFANYVPTPAGMTGNQTENLGEIMLRPVGKIYKDALTEYGDIFKETDKLFVLTIKSIVSKVLTTIGTYNMFNRPINEHGLGYFSGLRLILGGSDAQPTVIDEALELYIRLPLLAEFYKKIFDFDDDSKLITMIPEMSGTFSGLINIIFDTARHVVDGNYSDTEIRMLIEEINKIYSHQHSVQNVIDEFVAEINRRYGILKPEEREKYKEMRKSRYSDQYAPPEEITDFALKGINEDDVFERPAPSDAYRGKGASIDAKIEHKYKINDGDCKAVHKLRENIDKLFKDAEKQMVTKNYESTIQGLEEISFTPLILARKEELKYAKNNDEKYKIIRATISGLGKFVVHALEKSYISFHEMVVMPINTLYVLYKLLHNFHTKIMEWYKKVYAATHIKHNATTGFINQVKTPDELSLEDIFGARPFSSTDVLYPAGVYKIATQITPNSLAINVGAVKPADDAGREVQKQTIARFSINQDKLSKELFELLFAHASTLNDLVNLNIESRKTHDNAGNLDAVEVKIGLDHSKLRETVYTVFNEIKSNIDKYRGLLPQDTIDKFVNLRDQTGAENEGSLFWLEKYLIDELLDGKTDKAEYSNLDKLGPNIQEIMNYLTKKWTVDGTHITNITAPLVSDFNKFDAEMHEIVYLDMANLTASPDNIQTVTNTDNLSSLWFNTSGQTKKGVAPSGSWFNGLHRATRFYSTKPLAWYNSPTAIDGLRGIIFEFNRLIASYINQIYDSVARKVYQPAINEFANGMFSDAVIGNDAYKDCAIDAEPVQPRYSQQNLNFDTKVLFRSLALALRQLVTEKTAKSEAMEFIETSMANMPFYMRERYRANLPVLLKLFKYLAKRAELAKQFTKSLNVNAPNLPTPVSDKDNTTQIIMILDRIISGIDSIKKCITQTLQDLNDSPKFMETYKDFIAEYEANNGRPPFMPQSNLEFSYWKTGDTFELAPVQNMGNMNFKYLYGTRGVLCKDLSNIDDFPGMKNIINDHNDSTDVKFHLDIKKADEMIQKHTLLSQYIVDSTVYRDALSLFDIVPGAKSRRNHCQIVPNTTLGVRQKGWPIIDVIKLTENTFQREERSKIVKFLYSTQSTLYSQSRDSQLVYNIIDLNIVPVNVHALMREIPLINLYNHSFTFDKLFTEVYGLHDLLQNNKWNCDNLETPLEPKTALELLGLMSIHPYHEVSVDDYEKYFPRIVRGALGVEGLGRPRYLDQIYNKPLFGEIIEGKKMEDEAGPAFGHAHGEGKMEVLLDKNAQNKIIQILINTFALKFAGVLQKEFNTVPFPPVPTGVSPADWKNVQIYMSGGVPPGGKPLEEYIEKLADIFYDSAMRKYNLDTKLTNWVNNVYDKVMPKLMGDMLYQAVGIFTTLIYNTVNNIGKKEGIKEKEFLELFRGTRFDNLLNEINNIYNKMLTGASKRTDLPEIMQSMPFISTLLSKSYGIGAPPGSGRKIISVAVIPTLKNNLLEEIEKILKDTSYSAQVDAKKQAKNYFNDNMHFIEKDSKGKIVLREVSVTDTTGYCYKPLLKQIGFWRFNTRLVRNILWLVNIQRTLRLKLSRDLRWYDSKVVSSNSLLASSITEAHDNDYGISKYTRDQYY